MPKIAHFIDSHDPGGAETLVVDICRQLDKNGFTPEILHFGNPWIEEKCRQYGITEALVPGHEYFRSSRTIPIFTFIFSRFLKSRQVNLLHSHLFGAVTGACFSTFMSGIPHIGTLHDTYTIDSKKSRIHLLRLAAMLGTRLVVVSQQMRNYLLALASFNNKVPQVVLNGVTMEKFTSPADNKLRIKLGIQPSDIILICVGRLVEIKGYPTLLQAFSRINQQFETKLIIVGEGPERRDIEEEIIRQNLSAKVIMLGQRDDVPELLKISDCFVLASHSEGLSCSIIEAMAAGLPVVATDVGGNNELVTSGRNGYLVPPGQPEDLAKILQLLLSSPAMLKEFGGRSQEMAREKFSMETMMKAYVNNYQSLLLSINKE